MRGELERVDGELQIDQPAGTELQSSGPRGGLWRCHVGPHPRGVRGDVIESRGHARMSAISARSLLAHRDRTEHRPRSTQRHMLPGPGLCR